MDIADLLVKLDTLRIARGMSYQTVADACGVSKATIYRALTGVTEPTAQLVQRMEAAVQYNPECAEQIPPPNHSPEEYVDYLRATIARQTEEYNRHITQLQTHYSMLHRQDRRAILFLSIGVTVLVIFLIFWLVLDILRPEIGWIKR